MKNRALIRMFMILLLCAIISSFLFFQQDHTSMENAKSYPVKDIPTRSNPVLEKEVTEKISLGAIGDILIHDRVYKDAFQGGSYHFDPIFQNVKKLLETPDILTANQESVLGGTVLGVSGYPLFNSPHEVADALVHTGIDIVSTANNHALDKGEKGINYESDYLDLVGLPHVGSFKDPADQQKLRIIEKNGIKLAFLSYTYGTNGIPLPAGKRFPSKHY